MVLTLLEEAKNALLPPNFEVAYVLALERFKDLSREDTSKLNSIAKDKRKYLKAHPRKPEEKMGKMEKTQNCGVPGSP
jgi:hypothetical protein